MSEPMAYVTEADHRIFMRTLREAARLEGDVLTFVEIGTHRGQGAVAVMTELNRLGRRSRFLTFDINWDRWHRGRWFARDKWRERCAEIAKQGPCLGEFHERPGVEGVELVDEAVWLFVDGCHCQECVATETAAWASRIKPGGFILYHDCHKAYLKRKPRDQKFHGDGGRQLGVLQAVEASEELRRDFELFAASPPRRKPFLFGGLRAYRKLLKS